MRWNEEPSMLTLGFGCSYWTSLFREQFSDALSAIRRTQQAIITACLWSKVHTFIVRSFREVWHEVPPVQVLRYLQTEVNGIVGHDVTLKQ